MVAADEVTAIALGDRKIACTDWNCDARRHLSADAHHVVVTVRTADEAAGSPLSIARDAISDVSERFVAQSAKRPPGSRRGRIERRR